MKDDRVELPLKFLPAVGPRYVPGGDSVRHLVHVGFNNLISRIHQRNYKLAAQWLALILKSA